MKKRSISNSCLDQNVSRDCTYCYCNHSTISKCSHDHLLEYVLLQKGKHLLLFKEQKLHNRHIDLGKFK